MNSSRLHTVETPQERKVSCEGAGGKWLGS